LSRDLIENGFEIISPVRTNVAIMDPVAAKRGFGEDITFFWGWNGYENGAQQRYVPAENIAAMFEAAGEYGERR